MNMTSCVLTPWCFVIVVNFKTQEGKNQIRPPKTFTTNFLLFIYSFTYLIFILYWSIVDLQCCVSFRCTASDSFPLQVITRH